MVTQVTSPPGLKHYVNKNDDQVIFEEIPEEVFTVIEEKTIEELSQSMMLEKPTEQTLEEFAEFMASPDHVKAQDCRRHTVFVRLYI